jgi:hypothetical protein
MSLLKTDSVWVILGRSFWIAFGPMLLAVSGLLILLHPDTGWLTTADITYLATVAAMILGRLVEFAGGRPLTSTGEPATPDDFRRFAVLIFGGGLLLWVLANLISNYVLA